MHGTMAQSQINALVRTIQAHLDKAEKAADRSNQHYTTAGQLLKELKRLKPSDRTWPEYVRETFGLSQQRADELIRIADGSTTVEAVRANNAMRKTRERERIAKLKSNVSHIGSSLVITEFTRQDGIVKAACDFNPEDPGDVAERYDSKETIRRRIILYQAAEARRLAVDSALKEATSKELTDDIILAVQQAAEAWANLSLELQRRLKRSKK